MVLLLRGSAIVEAIAETTQMAKEINKSITEKMQTTKEINNTLDQIQAPIDRCIEYLKQILLNQGMDLRQINNIINNHRSITTNLASESATIQDSNAKADLELTTTMTSLGESTTKIPQQIEESTDQQIVTNPE